MATERPSERPHHRHLEQARAQVIDLLARQEVERNLVQRSEQRQGDVVSQLVERQHKAALEHRLATMHPADVAFVLEGLAPEARGLAWSLVRAERRGAVLLETSDVVRRKLIAALAADEIVLLAKPLAPEDVAALLSDLDDQQRAHVLERLEQDERAEIRSVLSFPSGSIGAVMDREVVTTPRVCALGEVHAMLQRRTTLPPHTTQIFVVDELHRPCGVLALSRLLLAPPEALVCDQMSEHVVFFYTDDPLGDAVSAFEKYDLVSAPVLNLHDQVVGRVTVDAVVDVLKERAQTEGLRQVGLSRADEDLFAPVHVAAQRRWPWLAINVCTALLASRVVGAFEPMILQFAALAALMPIVASIGGNVGNQSVALVVQRLSEHALDARTVGRFLVRETAIGALNGGVWGITLGLVALLLYENVALALVLAVSLLLNMVLAATAGVLVPFALQRLGRDPIMGSSIILTATTDSGGFLIFLALASACLGR